MPPAIKTTHSMLYPFSTSTHSSPYHAIQTLSPMHHTPSYNTTTQITHRSPVNSVVPLRDMLGVNNCPPSPQPLHTNRIPYQQSPNYDPQIVLHYLTLLISSLFTGNYLIQNNTTFPPNAMLHHQAEQHHYNQTWQQPRLGTAY